MNKERKRRGPPVNAILGIVLMVVLGVLGLIGLSMASPTPPVIQSAMRAG